MPRHARKKSCTGMYHVMLRGVNRQDLFHDDDDRYKFIDALMQIVMPTDDNGNPVESYCTIFAWCLMSNHIHLLIQEKTEPIGDTIKRVTVSYAYYYNRKYGRESTLFHDRFRSEPCNDYAYFWRLIRYIHRNPVKAGIATRVEDYNWSSWHEYINDDPVYFPVCAINILQRQMAKYSNTMEELVEFVNDIVDDEETIFVEMPAHPQYSRLIDDEVVDIIRRQTGHNDPSSFQQLDRETQNNLLVSLKKQGASIKQLQRITGIGRNIIQRAK